MKKEILRIQNLNYKSDVGRQLKHVSLCLMEGEITAFVGLVSSGKDLLLDIIRGKSRHTQGVIQICGKNIHSKQELKNAVYTMGDSNYSIENWSVAEYIGLISDQAGYGYFNKKKLQKEVKELFDELEIRIDVNQRLNKLTEIEKRLMDIVKACKYNAKILLLGDELEGLSNEDILKLKQELKRIAPGRMTVIVDSHSEIVSRILADKGVVFNKNGIAKKIGHELANEPGILERYILDLEERSKNAEFIKKKNELDEKKMPIYRVDDIEIKDEKKVGFSFYKGEITTILALDRKDKEKIFCTLSGRTIQNSTRYWVDGERHQFWKVEDFLEYKIAAVVRMGDEEELLLNMTVGENIMIPSLRKFSFWEYIRWENRLEKMLEKEFERKGMKKHDYLWRMGINERIGIILERWCVYSPKVLILLEPFIQCDTQGVALVKSYIRRLAAEGAAVVVIKSREEYMEDISDAMIRIQ